MKKYKTREEWLQAALPLLQADVFGQAHTLPRKVRISVGFPVGSRGGKFKSIGQCISAEASSDSIPTVFISPEIEHPSRCLDILAHELIHAMGIFNHGKDFRKIAVDIGLTGKMTATVASDELREKLDIIISMIGDYPHVKLNFEGEIKKQSTRMIKAACDHCGYTVRLSRKWAEIAAPDCPNDLCDSYGHQMNTEW